MNDLGITSNAEKHATCISKDFKTDISELCAACPLRDKLSQAIISQIVFRAEEQKSILAPSDFEAYLNSEIQEASTIKDHIHNLELANTDQTENKYLAARIEQYIWNKERIKALTRFKVEFKSKKDSNSNNSPVTLASLFSHISKYHHIIGLLVEKGYCEPATYFWKDQKSGSKNQIVAIIKNLRLKGYYKTNDELTSSQIMDVAKNTFGVKIGSRTTFKGAIPPEDLKFLPPASTIE